MKDIIISLYQMLHTIQDDPLWDDVYLVTFWFLLIITFIGTYVYYYVINKKEIDKYKIKNWVNYGLLTAAIVGLSALGVCFYYFDLSYIIPIIYFVIINLIYSFILYVIFSFVIFRGSKHAANTPFFPKKLRGEE